MSAGLTAIGEAAIAEAVAREREQEQHRTLTELRPMFSVANGDVVGIGFGEAMEVAHDRAIERGHRQVVTRCYSREQLATWPTLSNFWIIQDWR